MSTKSTSTRRKAYTAATAAVRRTHEVGTVCYRFHHRLRDRPDADRVGGVRKTIAWLAHPVSAEVLAALMDGASMCEVDVDDDGSLIITAEV